MSPSFRARTSSKSHPKLPRNPPKKNVNREEQIWNYSPGSPFTHFGVRWGSPPVRCRSSVTNHPMSPAGPQPFIHSLLSEEPTFGDIQLTEVRHNLFNFVQGHRLVLRQDETKKFVGRNLLPKTLLDKTVWIGWTLEQWTPKSSILTIGHFE